MAIAVDVQDPQAPAPKAKTATSLGHDYKGFVAGVGSGVAKLTGTCLFTPDNQLHDALYLLVTCSGTSLRHSQSPPPNDKSLQRAAAMCSTNDTKRRLSGTL